MRIDLHTHSNRSDGTDSPAELILAARDAGIDVVALTDHDTTRGWAEASKVADNVGVQLVRGIEISTRYAGQGVHLLAYLPDPSYPPLVDELDRVLEGRTNRLTPILARLRHIGIDLDEADVRRIAGMASAMGRPHVADALVARGIVADRTEAFERYLGPGGPAYVDRYAADLHTMLGIIDAAGGVSVIAHPWADRHDHEALDESGLADLKAAGLAGVEVDHEDHAPAVREELRALARNLDLVVTGSSDYHGTGKVGHALGCNTTDPVELERLLDRAREAAARSERNVPEVVPVSAGDR